ncbi:MAG TPA: hypothetical protein VNY52_13185 [Solirubrobacteraceae bacterium]|jgi:hypothetical protein|nr:hypothetical protein [Solirubrobacteraceae bacterium]
MFISTPSTRPSAVFATSKPDSAPPAGSPPTYSPPAGSPPTGPGQAAARRDPPAHLAVPARLRAPLARLGTLLAVAAGAVLLRAIGGVGFANYDTLYALVWGQQLARGETPQYGIPIAPTPHPLLEGLGVVLAPLGPHAMEQITVALGFLALSACGWAVYRLGALWFNRPAGALAALILLTRVPILSRGVRAYIDLPYLLLVLGALIVETRHRRAGAPVLALLALAGLLRPEAWVFAGLYWVYLALAGRVRWDAAARRVRWDAPTSADGGTPPSNPPGAMGPGAEPVALTRTPRQLAWLTLLVLAAPLVWVLSDWLVTGNAMWSLTNTRHTVEALGRETGIAKVPQYIPRRIGEILGPAALAGAALGGVLSLRWLRGRALPGALAGVVAVVVFAAFATVGLPINTRYAFLAAAILCIFCGAAAFGWMLLPADHEGRRWWMLAGALVTVGLVVSIPSQYRTDHHELQALARQQRIQNDLTALVDEHAISARCEPVGVPNHAPIPLLALWLETPPAEIVSAQVRTISKGTYVDPASREVQRDYILNTNDPNEASTPAVVPPGFTATRTGRSWRIFQRCG